MAQVHADFVLQAEPHIDPLASASTAPLLTELLLRISDWVSCQSSTVRPPKPLNPINFMSFFHKASCDIDSYGKMGFWLDPCTK